MTPKISSKFIIESDKSNKTPISNPVKTSTTSSQLTDGLSGTKLGSFGSLSNSTLAKSLKTSSASVSEVDEVATGAKTEETSVDETDVSLFTRETNGGASDVNDLDSTLSKLENDDACFNSMNSTIKSARDYLSAASESIHMADEMVAAEDFEAALSYWQDAQEYIENARKEAQKAGDEKLQLEIQMRSEVCKGQIEWLNDRIHDPLNSIMSPIGGVSCSGNSGNSFTNSLCTGIPNGLNNAAENAGKNLFGGNKTNGTGNAGNAGGTGSAGKSSGTGKTPSSIKSSGSNKSKELQYDRSKGEIKKAVQDSGAETTYNKGTTMIEEANKALPDAKSSLEEATREISCANIDIKELTETNRELMEEYSGAKQKVYEFDTQMKEQNQIQLAQQDIINECDTQLKPLTDKKKTLETSTIPASKKEVEDAKNSLAAAEQGYTKANNLPANEPNRAQKISVARTRKANAENALRVAQEKLAKAKAELKEIQNNIEMYQEKKTAAQETLQKASAKMVKIGKEQQAAQKELAEINKTFEQLGTKEKALKERLDSAYAKKTTAQNKISECEQKIIAGETYQDMGEELKDNAIKKVEDSKDTGESKWYTPLLSLFK